MPGLSFKVQVEPVRIHRAQIVSLCHLLVIKPATRIFTPWEYLPYRCLVVQTFSRLWIVERGCVEQYTGKDLSAQIATSYLRDTVVLGLDDSKLG